MIYLYIRSHFVALFWILLASCQLSLLNAQVPTSAKFLITCLDPIRGGVAEFQVGVQEDLTDIEVPSNRFIGPFEVPLRADSGQLDFFKAGSPVPVMSVTIAEGETSNLFIFLIPKGEGGYRVLKINAPMSEFEGGDRYLINATGKRIALKYGEKDRFLVNPGQSRVLKHEAANEEGIVKVLMAGESEGDFKLIRSETWYCDLRFRSFLFIYDTSQDTIGFYSVAERIDQ